MPNISFEQFLAGINKGSLEAADSSHYTQIIQISDDMQVTATVTLTAYGPNYYAYPKWTTTGLTSWWTLASFETATGANGVADSHGSNPGTISGDPSAGTHADFDIAATRRFLVFDGAGDYIDLGDITALDSAAAWTLGFRFRPDNISGQPLLSRYTSADANKQFLLEVTDTATIKFTYATDGSGATATVETEGTVTADAWHTLLVTHNTSSTPKTHIYLNGVDQTLTTVGTVPTTLRSVSGNVYIARNESDSSVYSGDIYDVAYWSTAELSSAEATAWHTDARTDRIVAGLCRIPGSLSTAVPNNRTMETIKTRRERGARTYQHQSTANI